MKRRTVFGVCFCICLLYGTIVQAQSGPYPGRGYWLGLRQYITGEYGDAIRTLSKEGGLKIGTDRWIDSVCAAAILGESYYQMGEYSAALQQYNTAVRIYLQYPNWLERIVDTPKTGKNPMRTPPPWGEHKPGRVVTSIPEKVSIQFGDVNAGIQRPDSGMLMPASLHSINAGEIMRCLAISIRRRTELLGVLSEDDELNKLLLSVLPRQRQAMMGSWMQGWVDIQYGLTLLSAGREKEGTDALRRGALISNGEHTLTPIVYIEMGKTHLRTSNYQKAMELYLEAATVAYYFDDVDAMREALTGLGNAYYHSNKVQSCPQIVKAEAWARQKKLWVMRTAMLLVLADKLIKEKQVNTALEYILEAEKSMGKRTMREGKMGAWCNYLRACAGFLNLSASSQNEARKALESAMRFMQKGSVWNFQVDMVDQYLLSANLAAHKANKYYEQLLREPTASDWALEPMESLVMLLTYRPISWENWFFVAYSWEKKEDALKIADMARRARFLRTQNFGGRLHALRMLLELPEGELTVAQRQRRADILAEYKAYDVMSKEIRELKMSLARITLPPVRKEDSQKISKALERIHSLSRQQEQILYAMVLGRRQIDIIFPPVRTVSEIQKGLPRGGAMLVFYAARQRLFVFLLNETRCDSWVLQDRNPDKSAKNMSENDLTSFQTNIVGMLREIGMTGPTTSIKAAKLKDTKWQKLASGVMADLTKGSQADFSRSDFSSLVIIPDNFTWYMPFEMLQVQTPAGTRPTISQFQVRYAPMASLGIPWKKSSLPRSAFTAIALGKNEAPTENVFDELKKEAGQYAIFDTKSFAGLMPKSDVAVSSVYGKLFERMVVFDDIKTSQSAPFSVAPMSVDAGKGGSTLADWMTLPWGVPRVVMMMGFHTGGESYGRSSRSASRTSKKVPAVVTVPGEELFLTSMSLLASGCDVAVLSRWRMPGDSAYLLSSSFLKHLSEHGNASAAWRYAVLKLASTNISLDRETRITGATKDENSVRGTYPAFWAGYMLIDSQTLQTIPRQEETPLSPPKVNPPKVPAIVLPEEEP